MLKNKLEKKKKNLGSTEAKRQGGHRGTDRGTDYRIGLKDAGVLRHLI